MVAYPDRGAGNDPKLFFFFGERRGGRFSLSPPRFNIFTAGNVGVMICLGQGGLRSLNASSYKYTVIEAYILSFHLHSTFPKEYTCREYCITRIQEYTDQSDSNPKLLFSHLGCVTQIVLLIVNRNPSLELS